MRGRDRGSGIRTPSLESETWTPETGTGTPEPGPPAPGILTPEYPVQAPVGKG